MDAAEWIRRSSCLWELPPGGAMRVPVRIHASEALLSAMDEKVRQQAANVASLPGIVEASHVMPDGHRGYGFPIGGVAAFDAEAGGGVAAGGVGSSGSLHLDGPAMRAMLHGGARWAVENGGAPSAATTTIWSCRRSPTSTTPPPPPPGVCAAASLW